MKQGQTLAKYFVLFLGNEVSRKNTLRFTDPLVASDGPAQRGSISGGILIFVIFQK